MARFYFDTKGATEETDTDGSELASLDVARSTAVAFLAEAIRHEPGKVWETGEFKVTVRTEEGLILFTLFLNAIEAPAIKSAYASG